jgi:hypothetical protein
VHLVWALDCGGIWLGVRLHSIGWSDIEHGLAGNGCMVWKRWSISFWFRETYIWLPSNDPLCSLRTTPTEKRIEFYSSNIYMSGRWCSWSRYFPHGGIATYRQVLSTSPRVAALRSPSHYSQRTLRFPNYAVNFTKAAIAQLGERQTEVPLLVSYLKVLCSIHSGCMPFSRFFFMALICSPLIFLL